MPRRHAIMPPVPWQKARNRKLVGGETRERSGTVPRLRTNHWVRPMAGTVNRKPGHGVPSARSPISHGSAGLLAGQPAQDTTTKRRNVEGDQDDTQRQHPETQHRQESDHAAGHRQDSQPGANARRQMSIAPDGGFVNDRDGSLPELVNPRHGDPERSGLCVGTTLQAGKSLLQKKWRRADRTVSCQLRRLLGQPNGNCRPKSGDQRNIATLGPEPAAGICI
jgi:hypothetical protein